MALKIQKEFEMRIHEQFYENVQLLTLSYKQQESFTLVFKKDMFLKNNKVGFQQVVYYLLEVLDKDVLKQKISTWPLYEIRSENEFRNEVMKYVNELNAMYEDANIPNIATSHLIMPGGLKFIKFMFKLSQLVVYQHLQRNSICPTMLLPVRQSEKDEVTKEDTVKIQKVAAVINKSVNDLMTNFDRKFESVKVIAQNLMSEICTITKLSEDFEVKLPLLQKELLKDNDSDSDVSTKVNIDLKSTLKDLLLLRQKLEKSKLLSSYVENPLCLVYNGEFSSMSDPMRRIRIENNKLNLTNLLESFNMLAEQICLQVKPTNEEKLEKEIKRFVTLNKQLESALERTNDTYIKSLKMLEKLKSEAIVKCI